MLQIKYVYRSALIFKNLPCPENSWLRACLQHKNGIQDFIHDATVILKDCVVNTPVESLLIIYLSSRSLKSGRLLVTEIILCLDYVNTNLQRVFFFFFLSTFKYVPIAFEGVFC